MPKWQKQRMLHIREQPRLKSSWTVRDRFWCVLPPLIEHCCCHFISSGIFWHKHTNTYKYCMHTNASELLCVLSHTFWFALWRRTDFVQKKTESKRQTNRLWYQLSYTHKRARPHTHSTSPATAWSLLLSPQLTVYKQTCTLILCRLILLRAHTVLFRLCTL